MFIISLCHLILAVSQTHWWWVGEYNSNCWRSIFLPAGCWSQNQWSAFRPLPLPSWQRFFLWNSASYSFCSNPPGAFANPTDGADGDWMWVALGVESELTWVHLCLLLPVQPDKRPLVGRHQATWAGFPCTDWYSGHQRTSHQLLWELECGRNTIWPHPQASIVCSVSLIFIRQESGRYETRQKGSSCFRETVSQYKEAIHWQPAPGVVVAGGCHSSYQGKRL